MLLLLSGSEHLWPPIPSRIAPLKWTERPLLIVENPKGEQKASLTLKQSLWGCYWPLTAAPEACGLLGSEPGSSPTSLLCLSLLYTLCIPGLGQSLPTVQDMKWLGKSGRWNYAHSHAQKWGTCWWNFQRMRKWLWRKMEQLTILPEFKKPRANSIVPDSANRNCIIFSLGHHLKVKYLE